MWVHYKTPTKLLTHSLPDKDSKIAYQLLAQAEEIQLGGNCQLG